MPERDVIGIITRIEDGCAYAKTEVVGDVFIPFAAVKCSRDTFSSLKEILTYQEEVRMTVTEQAKRNNCGFIATSVTKVRRDPIQKTSREAPELSAEVYGPLVVQVTKPEDSYAFAHHEIYGSIFVPGDAFDEMVVKNVSAHVGIGDLLLVKFKEQREVNNCRWIAEQATKHFELDCNETKDDVTRSWGNVVEVNPLYLEVWDDYHKVLVRCHTISYVGKAEHRVEDLTKLFKKEDQVVYKANMEEVRHYWANEWNLIDNANAPSLKHRSSKLFTSDSFAQTGQDVAYAMLRSILRAQPALLVANKGLLHFLPDSALPEDYVKAKNEKRPEKTSVPDPEYSY